MSQVSVCAGCELIRSMGYLVLFCFYHGLQSNTNHKSTFDLVDVVLSFTSTTKGGEMTYDHIYHENINRLSNW